MIFPTLAIYLAYRYPGIRPSLLLATRQDLHFAYESPEIQMRKMILEPLQLSGTVASTIIVIDGLDECDNKEDVLKIFSALNMFISEIRVLKLKFLITSRPVPHILKGFFGLEDHMTSFSCEVESDEAKKDIKLFFEHEFPEFITRYRRGSFDEWTAVNDPEYKGPAATELEQLCTHAAGMFLYAKAMLIFIEDEWHNPGHQLNALLTSPTHSGGTIIQERLWHGGSTIRSQYTTALQEVFRSCEPEVEPVFRSVLGAVVLAQSPITPAIIAILLNLEYSYTRYVLSRFRSLLIQKKDGFVYPFHHSILHFLTDEELCTDKMFYISSLIHHRWLLIECLKLMNEWLRDNISALLDTTIYSELDAEAKQHTDALKYACTSWHKHLGHLVCWEQADVHEITQHLELFQRVTLPDWQKAIGVLGDAQGDNEVALGELEKW